MGDLELWGGPECTVNRVADNYTDQIMLSGHRDRPEDIDLFASLGFKALRYPILWEHVSPDRPDRCDWSWIDPRLERLRLSDMRVIAGLIHHGSGPAYTGLLEDDFAPGLARHARNVAERYPWIDAWTPVNEPLTTARFSALYGHWHPHLRDERSFWLALLNQIDGTRLSMHAIRSVNPAAQLIQTDDLGRTYATAALRHQAGFDNLRRWAGWDLLCGHLTPDHPLWPRIAGHGLGDRLRAIRDDPCPPDIIGINHYLTSDRFLDHRLQRYPAHLHGGSDRQRYVDVEAVRALDPAPHGLRHAITECWARYGRPIAITEVHNGCTREEQMRWMAQSWDIASSLRHQGIDVRAVTAWSLLGSAGWNTLLTQAGIYEPGVWEVSSGACRPTALASLIGGLPQGQARHPLATYAGWWQRPIRIIHKPVPRPAPAKEHAAFADHFPLSRPLLICGATGTLGQAMARACRIRNIPHVVTGRAALDLTDPGSIACALAEHAPWAVVNAAGWVRVDDAEADSEACMTANAQGAVALAAACGEQDIPTLHFSSDLVFDGAKNRAYVEQDIARPLNVYGASKARMEQEIAALDGPHLIVRTAAFFSPHDDHNFAVAMIDALARGERPRAASDLVISPTYVPHLVACALDLLIDGETGLWHLTNGEALSWADFARAIALACGHDPDRVESVSHRDFGWPAPRPAHVPLISARGSVMPPLAEAIAQFAAHRATRPAAHLHGSTPASRA
ncbi:MAG: sugar nucleotide-binding protein [Sphingobium sp.]